jgi:ABC-type uncharacterized transport system substrate-binding protein
MIIANAKLIADLATKRRLPLVGFVELTEQAGALAYSIDFAELYRQAANYVVKILQGARPEESVGASAFIKGPPWELGTVAPMALAPPKGHSVKG